MRIFAMFYQCIHTPITEEEICMDKGNYKLLQMAYVEHLV